MTDTRRARRRLDQRMERIRPLADEPRPHRGWIRAIRDAMGMSTTELAARLDVRQQTISDLERSEENDTIKLESLRRVGEALDCDFVYFLVPRASLDSAVAEQARRKASQHLRGVAHHSRLENQSVSDDDAADEVDDLAKQLIDRRGLWSQDDS